MRLATIVEDGRSSVAVVRDGGFLPVAAGMPGLDSMRAVATGGDEAVAHIRAWAGRQPADAGLTVEEIELGPAVPDPGAIYTVGLNYRGPDSPDAPRPERPLIYGKVSSSVAADGAVLSWDRSLTTSVDPEVELGVVVGAGASIFGYTIIDDISSRDPWLDGDQWLLGKSMPGFCPVGPWIVTHDELEPVGLRLEATIDGVSVQDGSTDHMLYSIDEIMAYLRRHVRLRPGDLIATGTPPRLSAPPGPERHLRAGDTVVTRIEGIGSLTTPIA